MKKLNNKGFVLAETVVVAVFMVSIFMILYKNYYPLMGKFEKREFYDDVDSKYKVFWLKYLVEDHEYQTPTFTNGIAYFDCNSFGENVSKKKQCNRMVKKMGLSTNNYCKNCDDGPLKYVAFITNNLKGLQDNIDGTGELYDNMSDGFIDYVLSLPPYSSGKYLIIEIYDQEKKDRDGVYKYAYIKVL